MKADVFVARERRRRRRLAVVAWVLAPAVLFLWYRILDGRPFNPLALPSLPGDAVFWLPGILMILMLGVLLLGQFIGSGRSPHVLYRPEQIGVTFDEVRGIDGVKEEVLRTLAVFEGYARFRDELGGNPRRGVLFEGPPGTGKTHMAKAMAHHASVPFLFVSATAFQSMWYGATARKLRAYFKELRKAARAEGGAIGFIEEIDAIGMSRGTAGFSGPPSGSPAAGSSPLGVHRAMVNGGNSGVVNELLVQMQSFETPTGLRRLRARLVRLVNGFLPIHRQLQVPKEPYANILLIAATNQAQALDAALLRPGRFDRTLHFDVPDLAGRRDLVGLFLARRAHDAELDSPARHDDLAALTMGASPAELEHLFDEALVCALRDERSLLTYADVREARLNEAVGMPSPKAYTVGERHRIATHESGHAVVTYLVGLGRRMELLSLVKRRDALGLLAHSAVEERYTQTEAELRSTILISLGGMVAEELFLGESSTGPAGDLAAATGVAAQMVGTLGLRGSLVSFLAGQGGAFSGDVVSRVLGDATARAEVQALLEECKGEVTDLLAANSGLVAALRAALLERDELVEGEILDVLGRAAAAGPGTIELVDLREPGRVRIPG